MIFQRHHYAYAYLLALLCVVVVAANGGLLAAFTVLTGFVVVWQLGKRQGTDDLYNAVVARETS